MNEWIDFQMLETSSITHISLGSKIFILIEVQNKREINNLNKRLG